MNLWALRYISPLKIKQYGIQATNKSPPLKGSERWAFIEIGQI